MGTRHQQKVIDSKGKLRISQYGQWDGYPSGQGVDIIRFLRGFDKAKYDAELQKIEQETEEQTIQVNNSENWIAEFPYLSRGCGSNIHQMVQDGEVKFVRHISDDEAEEWCAYFYTINLQDNSFTSKFGGETVLVFLDNIPTDEDYINSFDKN